MSQRNKSGKLGGAKSALENLTNIHFMHQVDQQDMLGAAGSSAGYPLTIPSRRESGKVTITQRRDGGKQRKLPAKYGVVRSSMFSKNPIFDRMDVGNMATDDNASEYSVGYASQATRNLHHNIHQSDRYSTIVPADEIDRRS